MSRPDKIDHRAEQMEACPTEDDLRPRAMQPGHGIQGSYHGSKRGILVSMRRLKRMGVNLSKREREAIAPIVGELIINRVHDRQLDFHAMAEIVIFENYNFPSRQAALCNPVVFAADARGLVLHGIEKTEVAEGGWASFQQGWLVLFGETQPEPPF